MGFNKIQLYGNQICDYIYIHDGTDTRDFAPFSTLDTEPEEWNDSSLLLSCFNNNLSAGNSALTDNIVGYEIRRKKASDQYSEYVGTIQHGSKNIVDYLAANNETYTYSLYPASDVSGSGIVLSPSITNEVRTNWGYWSLLVVDKTPTDNVYYLDKLFKFELNLTTDDMSNNATVTVTQNFTRYPTVQYGNANYWSGGLTALCGFISCNDCDYIQTPNMIEELKNLTSDSRKMFLKDMDGNVWEVKITAPITISTNDETIERVKTVKISWTEVDKVSGISVINDPSKESVCWYVTKSGEVVRG